MKTFTATLSVSSLNSLLNELNEYKREMEEKEAVFLEQLASITQRTLQDLYVGEEITVTYEPFVDGDRHGYNVIASGEEIGFIEFGTGVYAGYGSEHANDVSFGVYPGSWSEEHAQTYQRWIEGGRKGEYPYNRYPTNAFPQAFNILRNSVHPLARAIFGEGH